MFVVTMNALTRLIRTEYLHLHKAYFNTDLHLCDQGDQVMKTVRYIVN